jgi:hypothetical protein
MLVECSVDVGESVGVEYERIWDVGFLGRGGWGTKRVV